MATKTTRKTPASLVERLRVERGWSQKEAARRSHLAEKTYIKVERGLIDKVRLASLTSVAKIYGIDAAELLPARTRAKAGKRKPRAQAAVAVPAPQALPLVNTYHGVVDAVMDDEIAVLFDGDIEGVWMLPPEEVPAEGRRHGAYLELNVYRYGPGEVRSTLAVAPPPPFTPAQRALIAELGRINQRR